MIRLGPPHVSIDKQSLVIPGFVVRPKPNCESQPYTTALYTEVPSNGYSQRMSAGHDKKPTNPEVLDLELLPT